MNEFAFSSAGRLAMLKSMGVEFPDYAIIIDMHKSRSRRKT